MSSRFTVFLSLLFFLSSSAWGKRFTSQYCEFELPPGWVCQLEGTEWICQSSNKNRKKEAIIILAAKIRGSQDSLDQYMSYLKQRKTFTLPGGRTQVSEPKTAKMNNVNNHRWVDSLHLASEVPGFYTRYLATVKEDLGVAVTFSVAKDFYASYQPVFDKIVATLRVFRQKNVNVSQFRLKEKDENLLEDTTFIPDAEKKFDISNRKKRRKSGGSDTSNMIILLAVLGGAAFVLLKLRKKKGGKKKGKKKKSKKS